MTNIKKIGLTALAGTLASFSANAGEMSVSGTAQMVISSDKSSTSATLEDNTDKFEVNSSLVFSGSGELDNGFGVSVMSNLTGGAQTVANMKLDMGDMGTLSMDTGSDLTGLPAYQDKVPTAGEQVWDDTGADHGEPAQGVVNPRADNTIEESLGYAVSMEGFTLSTHASFGDGDGTEYSAVIAVDGLVDGLEVGAGLGNNWTSATAEDDLETMYIKYAAGPITIGAQRSDVDKDAATTDIERTAYGVSFAVNENLSVSYGVSDTDFESSTSDEENEGISASYTAGGATIGFVHNTKDNAGGTANADHETTELKLTFAF
jgi:outer membrane protein OmpU